MDIGFENPIQFKKDFTPLIPKFKIGLTFSTNLEI